MTEQAENIDAINRYILTQPVRTPKARSLRDEWITNYAKLSWFDTNYDSDTYDWVRNRRNEFDYANATTPAELAAAKQQHGKGLSSEEMRGEPDRRLSTGDYVDPPNPGAEPFFPTRVKVAAAAALAALIGLKVLKKLYIDPYLPKRRS